MASTITKIRVIFPLVSLGATFWATNVIVYLTTLKKQGQLLPLKEDQELYKDLEKATKFYRS
jgi:hypothetical protein